jgi:hypothetical protein
LLSHLFSIPSSFLSLLIPFSYSITCFSFPLLLHNSYFSAPFLPLFIVQFFLLFFLFHSLSPTLLFLLFLPCSHHCYSQIFPIKLLFILSYSSSSQFSSFLTVP